MKTKMVFIVFLLIYSTVVVMSQNSKLKVWKTIELGADDKSTLIKKVETEPGSETKKNLNSEIKMENKKHSVKLVLVSLEQLGYKHDTRNLIRYDTVCNLANKQGLKLCPGEVLLRLPFNLNSKDKELVTVPGGGIMVRSYIVATRVFNNKNFPRYIYCIYAMRIFPIILDADYTAPETEEVDLLDPYEIYVAPYGKSPVPSFVFMM